MSITLSKKGREELRKTLLAHPPEVLMLPVTILLACLDILDILDGMKNEFLYAVAWKNLQQVFGEQLREEDLDLMDSVLRGVKLEIEDDQKAREESKGD